MESQLYNAANDLSAVEEESQGYNLLALSDGFDEQLQELIHKGSLDFDTWTSIIAKIEKTCTDDVEKICSVYDSFLLEFPLCHGYWRKFAAHKAHLCTTDKVVEIFERAVQSATYSVGVWDEYCSFSMLAYEDPSDIRRLFKRAMSFVGKDYLCHPLWDKYIEFEFSQQQWRLLAQIYVLTLKFPTKRLHCYYQNFKKFAAILEEEMKRHEKCSTEMESESVADAAFTAPNDEVSFVINSLLDPSTGSFSYKALQKYISIGESFYQEACELERKIHCFETNIRRPYFHVMPLDGNQLENWHRYLDFVEMQPDFDWAVKLYERCLIPCADYPEFWMRYVEFMETKGGRELANFALDRATKVFLKNVPAMHLFNARFKEQIGDRHGALAAFHWSDNESSSDFIETVVKEANMEKRLGNFAAASSVYEKALVMAAEKQKLNSVPILYIHFSRLKYMMTGSIDAARDIIIDGIQHVPHCKLLLEGLIHFLTMHGGLGQVNVVDTIIADAISPGSDGSQGLAAKDREDISALYLQFVDQCGTVHDITKTWNRHLKLFPHLLRTTSSNKLPTSGTQLLDVVMGGKRKNPFPMRYRPAGDHNPDRLTHLQMQEQTLSLPESHAIHPDQDLTNQLQPEDKDNREQERLQQSSPKIAGQCMEDESVVNKPTHASEHQSGDDASEQMESTPCLEHQSTEAAYEPMVPTFGLVDETGEEASEPIEPTRGLVDQPEEDAHGPMEATHCVVDEPGEDASGPTEPTHDLAHQVADHEFSDASQKDTDSMNVQQEQDHVRDHGLSLNSQEKDCGDSTPMSSNEHQSHTSNTPEKDQKAKNSPSIVSPGSTRSADSAQIQNESLKPSSRFHRDSQDQQYQQNRVSPPQERPPAEMSAQTLTSQGYSCHPLPGGPGQNPQVQGIQEQNWNQVGAGQGKSTINSWPTQNLQQQSFVSAHQLLPPSHPQAQMPQFSIQSGGQYGNAPYNQVYNQMMENYYRQQQQQQPQQMIVQQHYGQQQQFMQQLQQEVQQPYQQQQHLLQPYQQQELYVQQQQQLAQLYYQQFPQLQEQQVQLMQQQQLMHAHQQQDQLYHQFMQQQQAYQQQQQQIPLTQIPTWNGSYYQQGQQVMPARSTSSSESPHPQQQSQGLTPPHNRAAASGSAVSPSGPPATSAYNQFPTWNRGYYQQQSSSQFGGSHSTLESGQQCASQGQQVMPARSTSSSESPHPQQQSQGLTPPHNRAAASGSAVSSSGPPTTSPHNQFPTSNSGYYQQQSSSQFGGSHSRLESVQQSAYQGQQVMPARSTSSSESPHPLQQSQGFTPPHHHAAASGSSVSPSGPPTTSPYNQK